MRTVWKFEVAVKDEFELVMPLGAEILDVGRQARTVCLWALVDPSHAKTTRRFALRGTGHEVEDGMNHVGSFQVPEVMGPGRPFVGHLFERVAIDAA